MRLHGCSTLGELLRVILIVALTISGGSTFGDHAPLPEGITPVMATWLWGYHTIPGSITRDGAPYWYAYPHTDASRISDPPWTEAAAPQITPGAKSPAVLVLHRCMGFFRGGVDYRKALVSAGYALLEPDAFARPGHGCTSGPRSGHQVQARLEEIAYALNQIRELSWIDQDRIILMGFGKGGDAAARWRKPSFAAHIIVASDCGRAGYSGAPRAPEGVPVLAAVGTATNGSCQVNRRIGGSKSILIPGAGHVIPWYPDLHEAVMTFLRQCCE